MIVVTDASPLHYLVCMGHEELLKTLFGDIICPQTVLNECLHPHAPKSLREWAAELPAWMHVISDSQLHLPQLSHLDPGERAAIQTAVELKASIVLMDEKKGRLAAESCGLVAVGVLGILVEAARMGLLDFELALGELMSTTNFRASTALLERARATLAKPSILP